MDSSGRCLGVPLLPPSQPTQAPERALITGLSAVTRPPGESSQPCSPECTGSRFATATTGRTGASSVWAPERAPRGRLAVAR
jgi:hypothetical protein